MTLDDMFKQYVHNAVEEYLKANLDIIMREYNVRHGAVSSTDIQDVISDYLSGNNYMTRDDVKEEINGADVRIESVYLSA